MSEPNNFNHQIYRSDLPVLFMVGMLYQSNLPLLFRVGNNYATKKVQLRILTMKITSKIDMLSICLPNNLKYKIYWSDLPVVFTVRHFYRYIFITLTGTFH